MDEKESHFTSLRIVLASLFPLVMCVINRKIDQLELRMLIEIYAFRLLPKRQTIFVFKPQVKTRI